jgi:ABC-type molybdate transport system substrate-binding protein
LCGASRSSPAAQPRRSQNAKEFVVIGALVSGDDPPVVIVYPIALVAASANPDAAFFLAYLMSQVATKVFLEQCFEILSKCEPRPGSVPV